LFFFAIRLHLPERSVHALLVENEDLAQEKSSLLELVEELKSAINLLSLQANYCESVRGIVLAHSRRPIASCEEFRAAIDDVAAPIYIQTEEFFGCGASEGWCFTVYLYSRTRDCLVPIWRRASPAFLGGSNPRKWGRGEGHVGKAFVDQKAIITGNATSEEVADFSAVPPGKRKDYDAQMYVSFASIPIGPILKEDGRPYGVLVGTSDRPGRFDRENTAILVQVSGVIASFLIGGRLDVDELAALTEKGIVEDLNGSARADDPQ
jgi:hypothetical protein